MSDLQYIDDLADQCSMIANEPNPRSRRRFGLSPNILRHAVARPKVLPSAPPVIQRELSMPVHDDEPFTRHAPDYPSLIAAFRDRSEQLEISRLELDRVSGLTSGHSGKLLSEQPRRSFGLKTLGPVLESLGLTLLVVENSDARAKTLARRTPFEAGQRRVGNHSNPRKET